MATRYHNLIVGAFVLMGMVVFGGLIVVFGGGRTVFTKTYAINAEFAGGVSGLQGGQTVTLNGKRVGETKDISFIDENRLEKGVMVKVIIDAFEIPSASEMIVSPPTMGLGKPLIQIMVLNPEDHRKLPMDGTGVLKGRMVPAIDQLVPKEMQSSLVNAATHIGELAAAMTPAAHNFSQLLEQRDMKDVDMKGISANLATMIQRLDATLKSFNEIFGSLDNQKNLSDLLANARKISESGVTAMQNVSEMSNDGKTMVKDMSLLMRRLAELSDDISGVMKRMDTAVAAMNTKSGTVGLLLNDNRLYEEMLLTMKRLTKLADDFRDVADLAKKGQLRIKAF